MQREIEEKKIITEREIEREIRTCNRKRNVRN